VINPPDNFCEKVPREDLFAALPPKQYPTLLALLDFLLGYAPEIREDFKLIRALKIKVCLVIFA
jgi:hypothetical protein